MPPARSAGWETEKREALFGLPLSQRGISEMCIVAEMNLKFSQYTVRLNLFI
ncbi:MAG: hypothetical protein V1688_05040 [bacterium]